MCERHAEVTKLSDCIVVIGDYAYTLCLNGCAFCVKPRRESYSFVKSPLIVGVVGAAQTCLSRKRTGHCTNADAPSISAEYPTLTFAAASCAVRHSFFAQPDCATATEHIVGMGNGAGSLTRRGPHTLVGVMSFGCCYPFEEVAGFLTIGRRIPTSGPTARSINVGLRKP